ncbi:MAG: hypothetical protein ACYC2H_01520 [Thermoplasmatota archaeon]
MDYYMGVDPGVSGGIALIDERAVVIFATAMPDTPRDILDTIARYDRSVFAVLEHVWSMPGWGNVGPFKFGISFGELRMALTAQTIPFDLVMPKKWQKVMGVVYPKGKPRDKNVTKQRAQALFPSTRVTHAIADALLLAEYGRRTRRAADVLNVASSATQRAL